MMYHDMKQLYNNIIFLINFVFNFWLIFLFQSAGGAIWSVPSMVANLFADGCTILYHRVMS